MNAQIYPANRKTILFTKNWNIYVNIRKLRMGFLGKGIAVLVAAWHFFIYDSEGKSGISAQCLRYRL